VVRVLTALVLSLPLIGAYAIFALGIVLIYRASRMLNLAHGAMAMVPAYLLYAMVKAGIPVVVASPLAIASGALLGLAVERIFVSRLRSDGPTAQTVGTIAALGLMVAVSARVWGTSSLPAVRVFPAGRIDVGLSSIQYGEIGLFVVMLIVAAVLYAVIQRTDLGLMMRGTAESRLAASLMGVNPGRITSLTWMLGGALAALAGILLASVTALHPYTLTLQALPAFIAALLGGLGSLPGALIGAAVVGATQGLVPVLGSIGKAQGAAQLFLAGLAIVVMATRGKRLATSDDDGPSASGAPGRTPSAASSAKADRPNRTPLAVLALGLLVSFPYLPGVSSSLVATANLAAIYCIIAVSLVLLTGWVGQISLGHAALVGIGAYATGHVVEGMGIPFPFSLVLAAAVSGAAAAMLGAVALRVRGLYLAVATLVFSWMASEYLFRQQWFIKHNQVGGRTIGRSGTLPFFDLTDRRHFFIVAAAAAAAVAFGAANIRESRTGRAFFAIRGSETAAASLGIDVMRYKLLAFVVSGVVAGAAGSLIMTDARVVTGEQFTFNISLFFVSVAVVGGLTSLSGAVASAILFAGLSQVFYQVSSLGAFLEIVSNLLLAVTLIAYRGGLASIPARAERLTDVLAPRFNAVAMALQNRVPLFRRGRGGEHAVEDGAADAGPAERRPAFWRRLVMVVAGWVSPLLSRIRPQTEEVDPPLDFQAALASTVPTTNGHAVNEVVEAPKQVVTEAIKLARATIADVRPVGDRESRRPLIEASNVTVRFGGLVAVNDASLKVREGEIVGLIGPNGAGKTTFFNAIAGYNSPSSGTIHLYGKDVTALPVHRRARVGVARTFQLIQLFRELSVFDNLMVATHVHNPTGFASHLFVSSRSVEEELVAVQRVREVLQLLSLEDIAHRRTGDLPFGVLRMVEVARALVTGFRVVMLDEPASGLDNTETNKLIEVLRFVRGLGVTLLLIEHDVRMVTGVSDYLYVLDQGRIIAEGYPRDVQRNPDVIAAYLGGETAEVSA
jgi:ABC-type branched-subunit amino acid transport system ATPase component/ABC-type branched-subunit amino acid transport system permease subunit